MVCWTKIFRKNCCLTPRLLGRAGVDLDDPQFAKWIGRTFK